MKFKLWGRAVIVAAGGWVGALASIGAPVATAAECEDLRGAGSSLQWIAQEDVWGRLFDLQDSPGCSLPVAVEFRATTSGKGKEQWGNNSSGRLLLADEALTEKFPAFIGTDTGASAEQEASMELAGSSPVVTVPVAQAAIAILVHTPLNCFPLSDTARPFVALPLLSQAWMVGRELFDQLVLGVSWSSLSSCEKSVLLIAQSWPSGVTAAFKRALGCAQQSIGTRCSNELESGEWKAVNETAEKSESASEWPMEARLSPLFVENATTRTSYGLAEEAYARTGAIGYADLADARALALAASFDTKLWLDVLGGESSVIIASILGTLASEGPISPESDGGRGGANCASARYTELSTVGAGESWGDVRQWNIRLEKEEAYPLCTLTFDLAWNKYSRPRLNGVGPYSERTALAVEAYLLYVVHSGVAYKGVGALLESEHYLVLPPDVRELTESDLKRSVILY